MRAKGWLKVSWMASTILLSLGAGIAVGGDSPPAGSKIELYVVGFEGGLPSDVVPGASYGGATVVRVDERLSFAVVATAQYATLFETARSDTRVRYAEWDDPTYGFLTLVPDDSKYGEAGHYGSKKVGAEVAWDRTIGSTAVKVAMVDTGLLKSHEEFAGQARVLQGHDFVNGDDDPNDEGGDCGFHGTHTTGTAGATINNAKGVAGMSQHAIIPVKGLGILDVPVLDNLVCTSSADILASALRYPADQGAHLSSNSWGGGGNPTVINDAIDYAYANGVTIVAAAGNSGSCTNCVGTPWRAKADKVIIVSSTTSGDTLSGFSSQGPQVDVAAPGSSVLSSCGPNPDSYCVYSGTSMATPHVAGTLALVKALNPTFGFAQFDLRIKSTTTDVLAVGFDNQTGFGRIDADAATQDPGPPIAAFSSTGSGLRADVDASASKDVDGGVTGYSWAWGDGSPAASTRRANHTYAAAGTYTIALTVTDDSALTSTLTKDVTVPFADPDAGASTLASGAATTDTNGAVNSEKFYKIYVPGGASKLVVVLDGQPCNVVVVLNLGCNPDLDLYVNNGARPTNSTWSCRPFESDSDETCTLNSPAPGWWFVRVHVFSGSVSASYVVKATVT